MKSHNPLVSWFHYFIDLYNAAKKEKGIKNKLKIIFAGPETLGPYYEKHKHEKPQDIRAHQKLKLYLLIQFSILTALFAYIYYSYENPIPNAFKYYIIPFVIYSCISLGFVLDRQKISFTLEIARIILMSICVIGVLNTLELNKYYALALIPVTLFIPWIVKNKEAFDRDLNTERQAF